MQDKRIIITGGNSGLGLEISKLYLKAGFEVVCLSRKKPDIGVIHIPLDYTDETSIIRASKEIEEKYNTFNIVIHCTGIGYIEASSEMNYAHSAEMMNVNLLGPSILSAQLLPLVQKNQADMLYVGATIGYKANEFMPLYSITKWGFRGLVENIRHELRNTPCRVISIAPPGMDTESNIGESGRATKIADITKKPIGCMVKASDIAEIIFQSLQIPKNIEMTEILINRK